MITVDSIPHAFTMPIAIAGWLVFYSAAVYADAPPLETFTKPAELVLTLSDDLPPPEKSQFSPDAPNTPNHDSTDKFIVSHDRKKPLNMDCGMNTNSNADIGNSVISRLSGACDLKYNY